MPPSAETEELKKVVEGFGKGIPKYIINTHGHFDHVGANKRLKDVSDAQILIHPLDAPMLNHLSASAAPWGLSIEDSPQPDREIE